MGLKTATLISCIVTTFWLQACASVPTMPREALSVPLVRQSTSYSCGAATMLAVLNYWNVYDGDESSLFSSLGTTPENGTDPLNMAALARQYELEADYRLQQRWEDLAAGLERGDTMIVNYQAWHESDRSSGSPAVDYRQLWEDGHYSVVVGLDEHHLYLMDPSVAGGYGYLKKQDFLDRWHDYEVRQGQRVENHQLVIYIRGKNRTTGFPRPLSYIQ